MASHPNILLITADDMDVRTPTAFGGRAGVTPRLDRLAGQGTAFVRAHVTAAVCQPSRSSIMTGLWPHRNGAEGFGPIRDGVPLLTDLLRPAGYLVGILGKVDHIAPVERFGWDLRLGMRELGMGRDPRRYGAAARQFVAGAAARGRPWFLMANAHDPHRPFSGSDQEVERFTAAERQQVPPPSRTFAPDDADPPGFLPDLPEVRREHAEYLGSARRCDDVVGAVLDAVSDEGQDEETLVVFLSDNGMALPFAKANCYLRSTWTPLVVRWPGVVPAGAVQESFASALDLLPTFCEAAGVPCPQGVDGTSLLPLLRAGAGPVRDAVHTVFHETSAGTRFEMRCVQTGEWGYVWNAWADGSATYRAENMEGRTWPAMVAAAEDDAEVAARVRHYLLRAPEELYHLGSDPDCTRDLAADPGLAPVLDGLRARVAAWMTSTGDPLAHAFRAGLDHTPADS